MPLIIRLVLLALIGLAAPAWAEEPKSVEGEVRLPLPRYDALSAGQKNLVRPPPTAFAPGPAEVTAIIREPEGRAEAEIQARLPIEIFAEEWILAPVLPAGTALVEATVDGRPVALVAGSDGLALSLRKSGTIELRLTYRVAASLTGEGRVMALPLPLGTTSKLTIQLPGTGLDVAVVPAIAVEKVEENRQTRITATVPGGKGAMLTWRGTQAEGYLLGRTHYAGKLEGEALTWHARLELDSFADGRVKVPLLPRSATLMELRVDGEPAEVLQEEGRLVAVVRKRGHHEIQVDFQTLVQKGDGPAKAVVEIPPAPVSRFELTLPGKKEIKVTPSAQVQLRELDGQTVASLYVPSGERVEFSWLEPMAVEQRLKVSANGSIFHLFHAEEGVLHGWAMAVFELTHGETRTLSLEIPPDVQVNSLTSPSGPIVDWGVVAEEGSEWKRLNIFLERPAKGEWQVEVGYERLMGAIPAGESGVAVPLLRAADVHRQRGMAAMMATQELTLEPVGEEGATRVGENQLPAFARKQAHHTVAHTFKYADRTPRLLVKPVAPERKQGKFDAQVDTLFSIGEVALKGAATVEIDVKSGALMDLRLAVPERINILRVSGPSLRTTQIRPADQGGQTIDLAFTQEMAGQFRVEVLYEQIMADGAAAVEAPTVSVPVAEVEHGRIAVEALAAVEVQPAKTEQLTVVEINDLPQQLVQKTTNPILLAYKYVHSKPPFRLSLAITRHRRMDVQVAAVESAHYTSLFTREGVVVTAARWQIRNSRRQFLRLAMPRGAEIWSLTVDGKAEQPAQAGSAASGEGAVLIKLINAATGFPVELVYAVQGSGMGHWGTLRASLPRPDMVVNQTRWELFLPPLFRYHTAESDMGAAGGSEWAVRPQQVLAGAVADRQVSRGSSRLTIPTQGVRLAFEKLYASQTQEESWVAAGYVSLAAAAWGTGGFLVGVGLLWIGILGLRGPVGGRVVFRARWWVVGSTMLLVVAILGLRADPLPGAFFALGLGILTGLDGLRQRWRRKKSVNTTESPAT